MLTPSHSVTFPNIEEIIASKIPTIASQTNDDSLLSLLPDRFEDVIHYLAERFTKLSESSAKYLIIKLDSICDALIHYLQNTKVIEPEMIAMSICAAIGKRVSLIDTPDIKAIMNWYRRSPDTTNERQSYRIAQELAAKPEILGKSANLFLVKLNDRNALSTESNVLGHYMYSAQSRKRLSKGESELYAIKGRDGNRNSENPDGIGQSYRTIEFDVATRALTKIRGYKNAFLHRKMTRFEEVIQLLQELIKQKDVTQIADTSTLEKTLEGQVAITYTAIKNVSNLTTADKVIATGVFEVSSGLFDSENLFARLCQIPRVQLDFTHLTQAQKDSITAVAGIIVDKSVSRDVKYSNIKNVGGIRIEKGYSAYFPALETVVEDIIFSENGSAYFPALQSVGGNLDVRYAKSIDIHSLGDIGGNIFVPSSLQYRIPEAVKGKQK